MKKTAVILSCIILSVMILGDAVHARASTWRLFKEGVKEGFKEGGKKGIRKIPEELRDRFRNKEDENGEDRNEGLKKHPRLLSDPQRRMDVFHLNNPGSQKILDNMRMLKIKKNNLKSSDNFGRSPKKKHVKRSAQ